MWINSVMQTARRLKKPTEHFNMTGKTQPAAQKRGRFIP